MRTHLHPATLTVRSGTCPICIERSVVVANLNDDQLVAIDRVDKPVLLVDSTGPVPGEVTFQAFRLTGSDGGITMRLVD